MVNFSGAGCSESSSGPAKYPLTVCCTDDFNVFGTFGTFGTFTNFYGYLEGPSSRIPTWDLGHRPFRMGPVDAGHPCCYCSVCRAVMQNYDPISCVGWYFGRCQRIQYLAILHDIAANISCIESISLRPRLRTKLRNDS